VTLPLWPLSGLDLSERQYEEVTDQARLHKVLEGCLDDYNTSSSGTMSLGEPRPSEAKAVMGAGLR
jgi:hypothetical protein